MFSPGSLVHASDHASVPGHTNHTLLKSALRTLGDVVKRKIPSHLGLGRRDFEMLIFAFARLHTADNPFHHAILTSLGSLKRLEPFAKTSLHTLTLVKLAFWPFPEHTIK